MADTKDGRERQVRKRERRQWTREPLEKLGRDTETEPPVPDVDEGTEVVTDWIVARIRDDGEIPSPRDVRRRAAAFCRTSGYPVNADDWLGV